MDVCFKGANLAPVGAALAANGSPFLQNLSLNYKGNKKRGRTELTYSNLFGSTPYFRFDPLFLVNRWANVMGKERKSNKENKKQPAKTAKEKKAAKRAKKNERGRIGE
jgi:hypothetical protein